MHLMTNGEPCGLKDDHAGHHKSADYAQKHRESQARYKGTAKGILTDSKYEAKRRGNR